MNSLWMISKCEMIAYMWLQVLALLFYAFCIPQSQIHIKLNTMENIKTHRHLPQLHFGLRSFCSGSLFSLVILAGKPTSVLHFLILHENCHLVAIERNVTLQMGRVIAETNFSFFWFLSGFQTEHFKHVCLININHFLASNILQSTGHRFHIL